MNSNAQANYRVALAINNVGVNSLHRGDIYNAIEAFKHAVCIMNQGVLRASESADTASTLQAQMMLSQILQQNASCKSVPSSSITVQPVSFTECCIPSLLRIVRAESPSLAVYPIRVDDHEELADDRTLAQYVAGVLLYNYGLSHYCLSMVKGADDFVLSAAARMLYLSHKIFMDTLQENDGEESSFTLLILCCTGIVLQALARALIQQSDPDMVPPGSIESITNLLMNIANVDEDKYTKYNNAAAAA
jgi:hypothetical protein